MCAICGIVGRPSAAVCARMLDAIRHRGPDSFDVVATDHAALGGCRLTIVGDGATPLPLQDEATSSFVLFNGEIYNYRQLGAELALSLEGHPDPESLVIARLIARDGPNGVACLKGMFAFAVIRDDRILLGRDRLGIKPLFYMRVGDEIVFGSEIKALLRYPSYNAELDRASLDEIAVFGYISSPERTPFLGIRQVPPGCVVSFDGGGQSLTRYWEPSAAFESTDKRGLEEGANTLRETLRDSLRVVLQHDPHAKAFYLSGGLDSSLLAALATDITGEPISTFTLADSCDSGDLLAARSVARAIGSDHHEFIVGLDDYLRELPFFVRHYENLIAGGVFDIHGGVAFQMLSRRIAENARVACSGEGADELFGGYYWTYTHPLGFADRIRRRVNEIGDQSGVKEQVERLFPLPEDAGSYRRNLFDFLLAGGLANYHLWSVDRSCGAFGFEVRPPYLHEDVVGLALSFPIEFKACRNETKRVLRATAAPLFRGLGLDECLTRLKEGMPAAVQTIAGQLDALLVNTIPEGHVEHHPYTRLVRSRLDCLMFDLFYYIFVANRGDLPQNLSVVGFYRDGTHARLYR